MLLCFGSALARSRPWSRNCSRRGRLAKMDAMTMPATVRVALEAYRSRLSTIFGARLREIRLFGSFARGDANEESDIDVLVLIDDLSGLEAGQAMGEASHIIVETHLPLSPIAMSTEHFDSLRRGERLLAREIDEQGISL